MALTMRQQWGNFKYFYIVRYEKWTNRSNKFFSSEFNFSCTFCIVVRCCIYALIGFFSCLLIKLLAARIMHVPPNHSNFSLNLTDVHHYYHPELDRIACQRKLKFHKFLSSCGGRRMDICIVYVCIYVYIYTSCMMRFTIIKHFTLYSKDQTQQFILFHFLN